MIITGLQTWLAIAFVAASTESAVLSYLMQDTRDRRDHRTTTERSCLLESEKMDGISLQPTTEEIGEIQDSQRDTNVHVLLS